MGQALIDSFEKVEGLGPTLLCLASETWLFFYDYFSKNCLRLILCHGLYLEKYGKPTNYGIKCTSFSHQDDNTGFSISGALMYTF